MNTISGVVHPLAAPAVAGVAALVLRSYYPTLTASQVKAI